MKWRVVFCSLPLISCTNGASKENKMNPIHPIRDKNSDRTMDNPVQDSANLIYSKNLQIKISALVGSWKLKALHMIDKNGHATEFQQPNTKIEFSEDHRMVSTVGQIVAESHWDYNNISNRLTTTLEKIDGSKTDVNVKQENQIIYLSSNKLTYQFDDPLTGYLLEFQYDK